MDTFPFFPDDDDDETLHEEWVPLGHGAWLIRYTWPDGSTDVTWAIQNPDGPGFQVHLGFWPPLMARNMAASGLDL